MHTESDNLPAIHKIALAFDGSQNSFEACEVAGQIAHGFKATLTTIYVIPPSIGIRSRPIPDVNVRASLAKAMSLVTSYEGVSAKSEILDSHSLSVYESVIDYASKERSDLLVSGTRGFRGFERLLLGSVSSNLVSYSQCSVLVVRAPKKGIDEKINLKRVLVATDGSENSSAGVRLAISFGKALSLKLTFVNIVYLPSMTFAAGAGNWYDRAIAESRDQGKRITEEAKSLATKNGVEAETKIIDEFHSPIEGITKFAELGNYDLIVVGTRGLGGFKRLFLGSVASGVVHYAHCSVLVVR